MEEKPRMKRRRGEKETPLYQLEDNEALYLFLINRIK
jgi:hypothetical protein